jgi:hypothetical protein
MVDVEAPPETRGSDRTTRSAAVLAAAFAVPIALVAGLLIFWKLLPSDNAATPAPSASAAPATVPTTAVQMAAPKLDAHTGQVCLAVTSQLPTTLRDLPGRKVTAGPEQNAAWGEPPITVACGVTPPTMCERVDGGHPGCVPLDATMYAMNGVCWWGQQGPAANVFTTMDRAVAVRVTVPSGYQQAAQWANEFSDAVVKTVKSKTSGVPTGCTQ